MYLFLMNFQVTKKSVIVNRHLIFLNEKTINHFGLQFIFKEKNTHKIFSQPTAS